MVPRRADGPAVADVLFGDYNPGGKLPITVPRTIGQFPIYYNHKRTGRPPDPREMYTSKYLDMTWTPLYPFGYGLSCTTFAYANQRLSAESIRTRDSLTVRVDLTNSGHRAGDEVAQLYLRHEAASVTPPVEALKGFRRLTLQPGETRTVTFTLGPDDFALYDLAMRKVVEPGTYIVSVGGSSTGGAERRFRITGDTLSLAPSTSRTG